MELPIPLPALLGRQRVAAHQLQPGFHSLEVLPRPPLRRQGRGGGLDDSAQLEQAFNQALIRLASEGPGEHVGIEQVPALARKDARASLRPAFDQSFRD